MVDFKPLRTMFRIHPFLALLAMLFSCKQPPAGSGSGETVATSDSSVSFRVETVASGLEVPWSIAFAPDGRIFVTERPGRIRVVQNGVLQPEPYMTVEDVEASGESGLMSMVLHPGFASNGLFYLSYAYKGRSDQEVRVVRYREENGTAGGRKVIVEGIPAAPNHAGCRMRFGPDGRLYITTGDATDREIAQQLISLGGKILRLNDDGTIPDDNPFVGQTNARPEIWSYGHRNPQGIDFQPGTGTLFETEHGPSGFDGPGGGDEVNIIGKGKNYGWPIIHHRESKEGLESPLLEYTPAVAPASGTFYRGKLFPQLTGNFLFGCLRGERIIRVLLDGSRVVRQENLFTEKYGRIRDIAEGPDGAIYFTTSNRDGRGSPAGNDDRLMKLVPAK
jgi:glucose/arabinose dehydrogenase